MKLFYLLSLFFLQCFTVYGQKNMGYDSVLARQSGADDYGMKNYVVAFLYAGQNKVQDSVERMKIQMAHLRNIQHLAKEGKIVVAGPFLDNGDLKGLFIFNVATVEQARELAKTDPAIKAGVLKADFHPWYGSAALMQIASMHESIQRKKFVE